MDVKDAVVVITGGGAGLGAAGAKEFAKGGARIVLVDLPSSPGLEVLKTLEGPGIFAPADVTSEAEVKGAITATAAKFGGVHVLINCAGIATAERILTKDGHASLTP